MPDNRAAVHALTLPLQTHYSRTLSLCIAAYKPFHAFIFI